MPPGMSKSKRGLGIRDNVTALMSSPVRSPARKKAILTIARRRNINRKDAKFVNSLAISKRLAKKK